MPFMKPTTLGNLYSAKPSANPSGKRKMATVLELAKPNMAVAKTNLISKPSSLTTGEKPLHKGHRFSLKNVTRHCKSQIIITDSFATGRTSELINSAIIAVIINNHAE
ncbi:hypothetical protein JTE90_024466 [Oedothorax gibbosus]|uniref:Uncharacterized protein n=1 Tax=Oedothorax gibbosus TaxID=931172 RepID=A0AAV6UIF0_9ARAC|nr:hypothetical protein JTE90_024466 [Oedothorax gibbosus]